MNRELIGKAVALLVSYREYTGDCRIANVCGEIVEALKSELAKPEQSKYSDIVSDGGFDPRNKFDAQPEHPLDKKATNARDLGLDYEPDAVQPKE